MKSARMLALILFLGFGLGVTLLAWGQEPAPTNPNGFGFPSTVPANLNAGMDFIGLRHGADAEMNKLMQEEAAAEREVAKLIESYSHVEGDKKRSEIKSKVATALEKEFDLQQKRRQRELERVEARVKKVREMMQKRSEARQTIVEKRLDQLIREADGLGWTPPPGVNVRPNFGQGMRPPGMPGTMRTYGGAAPK